VEVAHALADELVRGVDDVGVGLSEGALGDVAQGDAVGGEELVLLGGAEDGGLGVCEGEDLAAVGVDAVVDLALAAERSRALEQLDDEEGLVCN